MQPYRLLEHTADIALETCGQTIPELFENAVRGMFSLVSDRAENGFSKN